MITGNSNTVMLGMTKRWLPLNFTWVLFERVERHRQSAVHVDAQGLDTSCSRIIEIDDISVSFGKHEVRVAGAPS
jgi:hypothetical protein